MNEGKFLTDRRVHIGLTVRALEPAIRFYETLLGVPPVKVREGYAKFEPAEPSVNLSMYVVSDPVPPHPSQHFGIQVKTSEAVQAAIARFAEAGLELEVEQDTACCYAVQDKVWVVDPDGHRWEVFVVLNPDSPHRTPPKGCCP